MGLAADQTEVAEVSIDGRQQQGSRAGTAMAVAEVSDLKNIINISIIKIP